MRKPPLGEFNLGSLAGAIVGSIGGLFTIGVVRAILGRNIALLLELHKLGLVSFLVCGIAGWLVGGQIGPRLGDKYYSQRGEILGGALGGLAVMTKQEILLAIVGGIFVMETFSVIFQVGWFKVSNGKRIFRMAPIHHHFELKGWAEPKIIVRFWIISILLALVAISTLKLR